MMQQARDWLPKDAFTDDSVGKILCEPVAAWSKRWFPRACAEITAVRPSIANPRLAQTLHIRGRSGELDLPGRGKRVLLEAALDMELSGMTLSDSDHKILDGFAAEAATELMAALDAVGDGSGGEPLLSVTLSLAGMEMAVLSVCSQALIAAIKKALGPAGKPVRAPKSRFEALKLVPVRPAGFLGHTELTLGDLKGLGIGDVVVLENSLKDPVELRMPGSRLCLGRGKLVRTSERVSIQF
jgi:flagellar motor switch/type III secretory pathway protein FliN